MSRASLPGPRRRSSDRLFYAVAAAALAVMLSYIGFQHAPLRSELTVVSGIVTTAQWRGLAQSRRFEFRLNTSPLLFRVRTRLMPKSSSSLSTLLKPGTQVLVGHDNGSSFFLGSTDVLLLVVSSNEYYGPEPIHDQIVGDRPKAIALAFGLFLLAGYLIRKELRGRKEATAPS